MISWFKEWIQLISVHTQNQTLLTIFKDNDLHFVNHANEKYFKIINKKWCFLFISINAIAKSHSFIFSLIKSFTTWSACMSKILEVDHCLSARWTISTQNAASFMQGFFQEGNLSLQILRQHDILTAFMDCYLSAQLRENTVWFFCHVTIKRISIHHCFKIFFQNFQRSQNHF